MKLELVHFLTTDNLRLPGLLYQPDKKPKEFAIYIHGNESASMVKMMSSVMEQCMIVLEQELAKTVVDFLFKEPPKN